MKLKFAFATRHAATQEQRDLAAERGIELVPIGDIDAFTVEPSHIHEKGAFDGVVVVHPAAALRLCGSFLVGVFENANRAPEGEKPSFQAVSMHLYDLTD